MKKKFTHIKFGRISHLLSSSNKYKIFLSYLHINISTIYPLTTYLISIDTVWWHEYIPIFFSFRVSSLSTSMYMYDNTIFNKSTCKHVYPVIRAHKRQFANVDLGKKIVPVWLVEPILLGVFDFVWNIRFNQRFASNWFFRMLSTIKMAK